MAYEEWERDIPPDEQLQEVARLVATALLRIRRNRELTQPAATGDTTRARANGIATVRPGRDQAGDQISRQPQASRPFDDDADIDPWRRSKRGAFWRKHWTSIEIALPEDVDAVICQPHPSFDQIDLHEAFAYAMSMLCDNERRIATHVGAHGLRSAIRELGVTRRSVEKTLMRIRSAFRKAGFGVD
ncbi:MAG: hypothetical protein WD009_11630 [Phycisphaeraceae bacterium]